MECKIVKGIFAAKSAVNKSRIHRGSGNFVSISRQIVTKIGQFVQLPCHFPTNHPLARFLLEIELVRQGESGGGRKKQNV